MTSNENKDPIGNLGDKLRSFFGFNGQRKNKTTLPGKTQFSLWYFFIAMILFFYLQPLLFSSKTETISYSQFKQYVEQGIADELIIGPETIKGTLAGTPKRSFAAVRVNDPDLVKNLDERNISYSGRNENRFLSSLLSWILPLAFFSDRVISHEKNGNGNGSHVFQQEQGQNFRGKRHQGLFCRCGRNR